jgi:peptidyl-prolyl cis-trans isomerase C
MLAACTKTETELKGTYLAKVGNENITREDFDREFLAVPDYARRLFEGDEGKQRFLDEIIKKELLYQEALKEGFDKDPDFERRLEDFKKLTLISRIFEKEIVEKSSVSDQEVRDFFENNREEFTATGQTRVSHVLVKTEEEARKVLARLEKGDKFVDVAKTESIDKASAARGGDLGFVSRGQMVPEFEEAAFKLPVGELSQPVKTPFGYHVLKVTDRKEGPPVDYEKIKGMIRQKLVNDKQQEIFETYIAGLKKTYKIEINKDALSEIEGKKGEASKTEKAGDKAAETTSDEKQLDKETGK